MKILVTGTAGFIGSHLVEKLLESGHEVVGIDNINDYYDVNVKYGRLRKDGIIKDLSEGEDIPYGEKITSHKNKNYTFIKLNLEDKEAMMALFKEEAFDAVCNLAAQAGVRYSLENPDAYISSNIVGFMNILEACRHHNVKNLAYASSSSVYGLNESLPFSTEHNVDHPVSLYAATKKSNELMAHTYAHLYGIATTGLRFFTVYGPWGRPDMAPSLFLKAALDGETINVFNHGEMLRDFTYIDDIVEGIVRVIEKPAQKIENWSDTTGKVSESSAPYKVYNIGNNNAVKLMDFISTIENKLGKKIRKNMMPMQAGDVTATFADVSDLVKDMDYKPSTKIEDGVSHFVDWYLDFFEIEK